jgi:hypothetical protein
MHESLASISEIEEGDHASSVGSMRSIITRRKLLELPSGRQVTTDRVRKSGALLGREGRFANHQ